MNAQEVADKQESSTYGQISVYRMPDRVKITDLYSIDVSNATGELEILVEFKHQSRKVTIDLEKALERLIEKATIPEDLANLYYTPEELEKAKKDDIGRIAKLRFFANDEAYETSRRHQKDMVVWTVSLGFYTNAVPSRLTYGFDVFRAELRPGRVVESRSGNIHKRKRAGPTLWITNCLKNPIVHVESSSSSLDHVEGEYLKILSHFRKTNPDKPFQTQKRKHAPDKTLSPPPAPKSRPRLKLIVPPHGKSL
ncbi:hypothetical protein QFC22_003482 [Naganishia vaughanmartiniae]|uniref:Uncharacterized protein n=1 Tax=Naganishia vaughanmartiniae TaxID=1424756 RepID=A0ACC2X919_9TREE|nr:hypothetical protein QFC22_003482 [Naganishia vaughanmartiniae]